MRLYGKGWRAKLTNRQRQQLFDTPYTKVKKDYNESELSQLESQNEDMSSTILDKVKGLKSLGVRMGESINDSNKLLSETSNSFEEINDKLKRTFTSMMVMAQRSGISVKVWLMLFAVVGLLWLWIWLT